MKKSFPSALLLCDSALDCLQQADLGCPQMVETERNTALCLGEFDTTSNKEFCLVNNQGKLDFLQHTIQYIAVLQRLWKGDG